MTAPPKARAMLRPELPTPEPTIRLPAPPTFDQIRDGVCHRLGMTAKEFRGARRFKRLATARGMFVHLSLRLVPHATYAEIGEYLGHADHTSARSMAATLLYRMARGETMAGCPVAEVVDDLEGALRERTPE
jgi:chromosomal replication initiation ATPase DnaA